MAPAGCLLSKKTSLFRYIAGDRHEGRLREIGFEIVVIQLFVVDRSCCRNCGTLFGYAHEIAQCRYRIQSLDGGAQVKTINSLRYALALAATLLFGATVCHAQPDMAEARREFADVNRRLPELTTVGFMSRRPGVSYKAEARAWGDASGIVKIKVIERDDSGDVVSEFYYANASLVFVFESIKGFADSGNSNKQVTRLEDRYYFRDGKLIRWISGMAQDQNDNLPSSAEFADAAKSSLGASSSFLNAAHKAMAAKIGGKP